MGFGLIISIVSNTITFTEEKSDTDTNKEKEKKVQAIKKTLEDDHILSIYVEALMSDNDSFGEETPLGILAANLAIGDGNKPLNVIQTIISNAAPHVDNVLADVLDPENYAYRVVPQIRELSMKEENKAEGKEAKRLRRSVFDTLKKDESLSVGGVTGFRADQSTAESVTVVSHRKMTMQLSDEDKEMEKEGRLKHSSDAFYIGVNEPSGYTS